MKAEEPERFLPSRATKAPRRHDREPAPVRSSSRRKPVSWGAGLGEVTAGFDGGLISSDGGVVLLREAERRLRLAETLAGSMRDRRDPATVVHTLPAMLRFRMFAIACG